MSRSYKRYSVYSDYSRNKNSKMKRFANKKVRRTEIGDFGEYKKIFNSYDICDYKFIDFSGKDKKGKRK